MNVISLSPPGMDSPEFGFPFRLDFLLVAGWLLEGVLSHTLIRPSWVLCFCGNQSLGPLELNAPFGMVWVGVREWSHLSRNSWLPPN